MNIEETNVFRLKQTIKPIIFYVLIPIVCPLMFFGAVGLLLLDGFYSWLDRK